MPPAPLGWYFDKVSTEVIVVILLLALLYIYLVFSLIFIILAIFLLDRTTAKLRRTLGLVTIWPFFDQKWLFFDIFLTKRPYLSSEITISKTTSLFSLQL